MNNHELYNKILVKRLEMCKGDVTKIFCPEKPFKEMSIREIRNYVTFLIENRYNDYAVYKIPYTEEEKLIAQLNAEWDRRAGEDFTKIYNYFDKKENKEKWQGEIRYELFSYSYKCNTEFTIAKKAKAILNYLNENNISVSQLMGIIKIIDSFWYWDMIKEQSVRKNYEDSKNKIYQDEFVNYILGDLPEKDAKEKPWFNETFYEKER